MLLAMRRWELALSSGAAALTIACNGAPGAAGEGARADPWAEARATMVRVIRAYGVTNPAVLDAMGRVPRHEFIPAEFRDQTAYGDHPNPIGHGQTISQPYIVAYMTDRLGPIAGAKVLEIGTGSGYQAAILAAMGARVYTIEIVPELAQHARRALDAAGFRDVQVRCGDGYRGWPEEAPFDAIIVTCAPTAVPPALVEQLREGGRLVIPVGPSGWSQTLKTFRKNKGELVLEDEIPVRFVPMVPGSAKPSANERR
ncbi:MAG: protein-L-isoaspartate(D-aspartate) O-methyltransferase [Kiritimatiellae bacterium]|nr:protein-L-isoaspartate(D-aspartate) O-methyltransferase [Kiritimatiellia bacterium]